MKGLKWLLLVLCTCLLTACGAAQQTETPSAEREIFAMDTYISVTCYGEDCEEAVQAAVEEIDRLENLLSVGISTSEIARVNARGSGVLSEETALLVERSLDLWAFTGGAFDITVFPLMELWGFTTGNPAVPEEDAVHALAEQVGSDKLDLDVQTGSLTLGEGQGIDLGGIAKGYAAGRMAELFEAHGLTGGVASLGGDVQCWGDKPDGSPWRVGIRDPENPDDSAALLGILEVTDEAVFTSGAYERNFTDEATGEVWHHILDPATGYSAKSGLASVTVVSRDGILADGLSTACFVLGLEDSLDLWRASQKDFDLILMTEDEEIYVTDGIRERFSSDYSVTVVQ